MTSLRDRVAWRLANAALRVATPWYRDMIRGAIAYGLAAAARDQQTGATIPDIVTAPMSAGATVRMDDPYKYGTTTP